MCVGGWKKVAMTMLLSKLSTLNLTARYIIVLFDSPSIKQNVSW